MYKNLKTTAVECLENGTYHCTGNFFLQTIFFKIDQLIADNPKSSKQTFKGAVSDFAKSPSLIFLLAKSRVLLLS